MRLQKVVTGYDASLLPPGAQASDVRQAMTYRTEVYGTPFCLAVEDVVRGPSSWTVAERELMAAFVARQNKCPW